MRITAALTIILSSFALTSGAQSTSLTGKITDNSSEPIPFATVLLRNSSDSTLYKGEITTEKGIYMFENLKAGKYLLAVQMTGYQSPDTLLTLSGDVNLGTLRLQSSQKNLNEVTISADKPFIERQVDKTVVNIENSAVQAGSSIMEVMEKLPGVQVDQDGDISLKGKQGVIIMIDGKPGILSGQDLVNMLRGMSSSNIQKIELITNPSAKYEAAGNAGIINIVMKKNRLDGFNGSATLGYGQGRYAKYNSSISLNYKKDWYNLFLTYSYSNRKGFNNLVLTRRFYDNDTLQTTFETDDYIIFPFSTHSPRLGADFDLSSRTKLSILGSGVVNSFQPQANNHTDILDGAGNKVSSYDFYNDSRDNWYNYSANARITHAIDTSGQEFSADLDYARYWNNTDQLFTTVIRNAGDTTQYENKLAGDQNGELELYSFKADYGKPFSEKMKMEAGIKSSYVRSDNNMAFYQRTGIVDAFDSARSSHFIYSENINAAYLNFNRSFEKLSLQLGLRSEHTAARGRQVLNQQSFDRNYIQLFPTLFVDYKVNKQNGINLSLGRRIDRPGYDQMNPFKRLIDATTYSEGNPYLLPQLTYNSELSYSYNDMLFITAGYSLTVDNITEVLIQDAASRTTVQTTVNIDEMDYYSLNIAFSKKLASWWTTNTSFLTYYGIYSGTINNFKIDQGLPSFYLSTNNNFPIIEGLSLECNFQYNHKNLYGVTTIRSNYNLTIGVQKSFLKKKLTATVNMSDILWTAYPSGVTDFGNVNEEWNAKRDTRILNISLSYKFGNGPAGRMRRQTGADEEKSRIGNG